MLKLIKWKNKEINDSGQKSSLNVKSLLLTAQLAFKSRYGRVSHTKDHPRHYSQPLLQCAAVGAQNSNWVAEASSCRVMDMRHGVEIVCANAINTICPGKTVHFQIEKKLVSQKSSLANFWIWKYCLSPDMEIVFETFWRLSPGEGDLGKKLDLKLTLKLFEYEDFGGETSAKSICGQVFGGETCAKKNSSQVEAHQFVVPIAYIGTVCIDSITFIAYASSYRAEGGDSD